MAARYEDQLQRLFANVNDWLKFAEAKNFGLITLNAAIVFGFSQVNFNENSLIEKVGLYFFTPLALLSSIFSVLSLLPILSGIETGTYFKGSIQKISNFIQAEKPFENIHYYGYLRTLDVTAFITQFQAKTNSTEAFTEYEKELVMQILYNSRITWLKYHFFKIAGFILLLGIFVSPILLLLLSIICKG